MAKFGANELPFSECDMDKKVNRYRYTKQRMRSENENTARPLGLKRGGTKNLLYYILPL